VILICAGGVEKGTGEGWGLDEGETREMDERETREMDERKRAMDERNTRG
jgi:hypothetical protein